MNKNYRPAASVSLGTSSYKSPAVTVMEVVSEGVLCQSFKDNTFEEWGEEEDLFG